MDIGAIDRRTMFVLVGGLALIGVLRFGVYSDRTPDTVAAASDSIPMSERRLEKLRQVRSTIPGKEELLKKAQAELDDREKGMLRADTESQAQAQLFEIVQSIARSNGIDIRGIQEQHEKPLTDDYGEIWTTVAFSCAIEQLVNFMTALGNQPQILATNEVRVNGGNDKKKIIQVHLSVSAIVARKLIPKKAVTTF